MSQFQLEMPLGPGAGRRNHRPAVTGCVYCSGKAETRDHVPPKALLVEPWPTNLRTVPACSPCNVAWSLDEQYMAVVVAHLTENPRVASTLDDGGAIDRALAASPLLEERIVASLSVDDEGRVAFAPEIARISRIARKVAFGLHALKYGTGPRLEDFAVMHVGGPGCQPPPGIVAAQWVWPGIRRKRWTTVQKGIFSFIFARGWMTGDPPLYCIMNVADTLTLSVGCPAPAGRPSARRLRSKPWA